MARSTRSTSSTSKGRKASTKGQPKAKATGTLLTNSNARKARVRASGTCALCKAPGTHSVVQAKAVPAKQKAAQGYTLYCRKHAARKVQIRAGAQGQRPQGQARHGQGHGQAPQGGQGKQGQQRRHPAAAAQGPPAGSGQGVGPAT
jgi:hypothetical protein